MRSAKKKTRRKSRNVDTKQRFRSLKTRGKMKN